MKKLSLIALFAALTIGLIDPALAQDLPGFNARDAGNGVTAYSIPIQTLMFMTFLGFIPAIMLMMTGFTRIVIVMSLLRMALGTQNAPPNQVLVGLALFLTFFVMKPTITEIYEQAYVPYEAGTMSFEQALSVAEKPMHAFMRKQTRSDDVKLFASISKEKVEKIEEIPFSVLIPAFITSELKTAFQIGFIVFLPFLIIDLIVSSVLMSMGMMMLSPMLISLPFKLMLFVLVDGWAILTGSLVSSFEVF